MRQESTMRRLLQEVRTVSVGLFALALMACAPTAGSGPTAAQPPAPPAATSSSAAPPTTRADTRALEEFYRGKTLRLVVASTPGGGFDTFARILAKYMGKY